MTEANGGIPIESLQRIVALKQQIERRNCEKSYRDFVKSAWHVLEPDNPLIWNWHLDYMCDIVQAEIERIAAKEPKKFDLVVNIPPRSLKSMIFTRMPAAWAWIQWPWMRFMRGSYAEALALEHSVETRDIIQSAWYQRYWGDRYQLKSDQNNKGHFRTNKNGACFTTSTTAKATGRGANWVNIDDPLSPEQAESEKERARAIRYYMRTIKSRINNKYVDLISIVMQRLHEEDLTGYILEHEGSRYKHICLPAEDCDWVTPPELRKKYTNGYLFPQLFSPDILDPLKSDPYTYAGQYQQRPSPEEGGIFKRQNWRFWKPKGMSLPPWTISVGLDIHTCITVDLPTDFDEVVCSWDCAFKDKKTSDSVAGTVWAKRGADKYLLDERWDKMDYAKTSSEIIKLKSDYPKSTSVLIEDRANGSAIISDMQKTIAGVIPVEPRGSKYSRALPMARQQQSGNIYLPHPAIAPWANKFIEEFAAFPNGAHDDRVDSSSQAVDFLAARTRVWVEYKNKVIDYQIDFDKISNQSHIICSQWVDKSLKTSIVLALWNARNGKLWLFDEYEQDNSKPEIAIANIRTLLSHHSVGALSDLKRIWWLGNDIMHGKSAISNISNTYVQAGVSPMANDFYDESGAITTVSRLLTRGAIVVHQRAKNLSMQMSNWGIEGGSPAVGHGLCRSLCNMASLLWETGAMRQRELPLKEYTPRKTKFIQSILQDSNLGILDKKIAGEKPAQQRDRNSWIV